jgi:hypothetical protein
VHSCMHACTLCGLLACMLLIGAVVDKRHVQGQPTHPRTVNLIAYQAAQYKAPPAAAHLGIRGAYGAIPETAADASRPPCL